MQAELRNVLVLDDDERILSMYKRCFDGSWKVHSASTTSEALTLAQSHRIDAAVLDLQSEHRHRSRWSARCARRGRRSGSWS